MSFLTRLADRLILCPSNQPIDPEGKQQLWISTQSGKVEVWTTELNPQNSNKAIVIKFPGTGGRAERSGPYPANFWEQSNSIVWTLNHRGWGSSPGPATLANFVETCDAVWQTAKDLYPDSKKFLYGNSLGCISALYLTARHDVNGLYLRNPPPLKELISSRPKYAWPSLGLSRLMGAVIPAELDSVENAKRTSCRTLFITSEKDRVIPPKYQYLIRDQLGGKHRHFIIEGADHHHRIPEHQEAEYIELTRWLGDA